MSIKQGAAGSGCHHDDGSPTVPAGCPLSSAPAPCQAAELQRKADRDTVVAAATATEAKVRAAALEVLGAVLQQDQHSQQPGQAAVPKWSPPSSESGVRLEAEGAVAVKLDPVRMQNPKLKPCIAPNLEP